MECTCQATSYTYSRPIQHKCLIQYVAMKQWIFVGQAPNRLVKNSKVWKEITLEIGVCLTARVWSRTDRIAFFVSQICAFFRFCSIDQYIPAQSSSIFAGYRLAYTTVNSCSSEAPGLPR
jgi:hypothetical protein